MNKKFIYIGAGALVLLLAIVLIATSCSGTKNTTNSNSKTLTIWGFDDPSTFESIITSFQEKNAGYKITYVKKDPATYATDSLNEIAAGKGPDVWAVPNTWLPKYQDKLVAMPANLIADKKAKKSDVETYKTLFPSAVAFDNIINDKIYGMPLAIDTLVLYYNPTILQKTLNNYVIKHQDDDNTAISQLFNQGPKTWNDFVTMTKMITQKDGDNITQSAVALGTADNIDRSSEILTLLMMQDGAKMTSDDFSSAQFQTKQNVFSGEDFPGAKALSFYTAFANSKTDLYTWNNDMSDSLHAFAEGKTAMMFDYTSTKASIEKINANLEYEYFAVPQVRETKNPVAYASYMTYTVTKASKNPDLAWQFINAMTTDTSQTLTYANQNNVQSVQLSELAGNSSVTASQAYNAKSWYMPDPEETPKILKNAIKQVNEGKVVQTALEYAASQVTTLLGKLK